MMTGIDGAVVPDTTEGVTLAAVLGGPLLAIEELFAPDFPAKVELTKFESACKPSCGEDRWYLLPSVSLYKMFYGGN